jgi:hypothetical protein
MRSHVGQGVAAGAKGRERAGERENGLQPDFKRIPDGLQTEFEERVRLYTGPRECSRGPHPVGRPTSHPLVPADAVWLALAGNSPERASADFSRQWWPVGVVAIEHFPAVIERETQQ